MTWKTGDSYKILYQTKDGAISERTIEILGVSYGYNNSVILRAFCHLRGEERTFLTSRILQYKKLGAKGRSAPLPYIDSAGYERSFLPDHESSGNVPKPHTASKTPASSPINPASNAAYGATLEHRAASSQASILAQNNFVQTAQEPALQPIAINTTVGKQKEENAGRLSTLIIKFFFICFLFLMVIRPDPEDVLDFFVSVLDTVLSTKGYDLPEPKGQKKVVERAVFKVDSIKEVILGGRILKIHTINGKETYEVPSLNLVTADKKYAIYSIRRPAFISATGISNADLIKIYLDADLDLNGKLSFSELEAFQKKVMWTYQYQNNDIALRPDRFLQAKGGDCEDFALFTAGLLRFWGWEPYIGSMGPKTGTGHAFCLSYEEGSFPSHYEALILKDWTSDDGTPLKNGYYVPIDYDIVGGFSVAIKSGWKLRNIYIPEKAYGLFM